MLPPVRCTTCGYPVGDVWALFDEARTKITRAALEADDTHPSMLPVSDTKVDCGPLLDALGVLRLCCRVHLMTGVCFHDEY